MTEPPTASNTTDRKPARRRRWSFKIGSLAGIPVYVHPTFFLLLLWVGLQYGDQGAKAILRGTVFVLLLFGCVVLHELGHALAARRFGVQTRDIILLPIGGVARLERMPEKPLQELWVAVAGPLVNVAIAAGLGVVMLLTTRLPSFDPEVWLQGLDESFVFQLLFVNIFLVVFNMLPAFPMDGGRVLRAILATSMPYPRATRIAAGIGQAMAFLFALLGIFVLKSPFLVLIAFFVWIGAGQESKMVELRAMMSGLTVADAMITDLHVLAPHEPLARASRWTMEGYQEDFPVIDGGRLVGLLTQQDLMQGISERGEDSMAVHSMRRELPFADARESLEGAFRRLQGSGLTVMPVLSQQALVGLLTLDNVRELLMLHRARQRE